MSKPSIRRAKKLLQLEERRTQLEKQRLDIEERRKRLEAETTLQPVTEAPLMANDELVDTLIQIDAMLHQSQDAAQHRWTDNAPHLLEIINSQHLAIETLLRRLGLEVSVTKPGAEFDPELMQAHPQTLPTDDEELHGCVAASVIPLIALQGDAPLAQRILKYELVRLYEKHAD